MSQTFKSRNIGMKNTFAVRDSGGGVHFTVTNNDGKVAGCDLANADAPALALAILEAAGIVPAHHSDYQNGTPEALEHVAQGLKDEIAIAAAEAKEAADREALEADAWELYKARTNGSTFDRFHDLERGTQAEWIAVAKHARTMHGVTK